MRERVIVMADGGSRGNPGRAGCGAVVLDGKTRAVLAYDNKPLGICTNNVAEYHGLILGLGLAAELGAADLAVEMDSKLVVEQMAGRWAVKHPDIRPLAKEAKRLASALGKVTYGWVPREQNGQADRLANEAMDGRPPTPPAEDRLVTVRRIKPTTPVSGARGRFESFGSSTAVRVERTSGLAKALEIEGAAPAIAQLLIEHAPEELVAIWGQVPSSRWLAGAIASSPLSWRRGQVGEASA